MLSNGAPDRPNATNNDGKSAIHTRCITMALLARGTLSKIGTEMPVALKRNRQIDVVVLLKGSHAG